MRPPNRIVVFAGPSLPPEDRVISDALTYRPSAKRGDVRQAAECASIVLLIDGVFDEELAPSPKEVLHACRACSFIGASSTGALRAVECAPFGAMPCGAIAEWYRREIIRGDDEVAVAMDPRCERALTVPLVNVRYLARLARRRRLLSTKQCAALVAHAQAIFYADRTWDDVLQAVPIRVRPALAKLTPVANLKRMDARFALRCALRRFGTTNGERIQST